MGFSTLEEKFKGIWLRALREPSLHALTPALIKTWASEKGLNNPGAELSNVGPFHPTPCIVLTTKEGKACFPTIPSSGDENWRIRRKQHDKQAELWDKVEWFIEVDPGNWTAR